MSWINEPDPKDVEDEGCDSGCWIFLALAALCVAAMVMGWPQ